MKLAEVKGHAFFSGLDWQSVLSREVPVPFKPKIEIGELDVSNIDRVSPVINIHSNSFVRHQKKPRTTRATCTTQM